MKIYLECILYKNVFVSTHDYALVVHKQICNDKVWLFVIKTKAGLCEGITQGI